MSSFSEKYEIIKCYRWRETKIWKKNKNSNQIWGINNNIKFVKDTVKKGKGIQCGECE